MSKTLYFICGMCNLLVGLAVITMDPTGFLIGLLNLICAAYNLNQYWKLSGE